MRARCKLASIRKVHVLCYQEASFTLRGRPDSRICAPSEALIEHRIDIMTK